MAKIYSMMSSGTNKMHRIIYRWCPWCMSI